MTIPCGKWRLLTFGLLLLPFYIHFSMRMNKALTFAYLRGFMLLTLLLAALLSKAQNPNEPLQLSGLIVTEDSVPQYVPYAHVLIRNRSRGTMSSSDGFFSLATMPGDTIEIQAIGFKKEKLPIPADIENDSYLARVVLRRDTTMLKEVTLYPWPTPERFEEAFLEARVPATQNDIAMRNLAIQELKERAAEMGYSAAEMQDYALRQQEYQIYNYGRYQGFANGGTAILGAFTDPFAWARFFESLKK